MIKSEMLMRMEEAGIFYQDRKTGTWHNGFREEVDLTPYLLDCSLFEH